MIKPLILWGAGGHGKVVLEAVRACGSMHQAVFVDDDVLRNHAEFCHCAVMSVADFAASHAGRDVDFVICIGSNRARSERYAQALAMGFSPALLVHPSAYVSESATIGGGTVVLPRAIINPGAVVGRNCIINTGAIVEHDCHIGDHVHISPGAVLGGGVHVGHYALVGLNASVLPEAVIGERATVGAGSVVLDTIPAGATAVGVPARVLHFKQAR